MSLITVGSRCRSRRQAPERGTVSIDGQLASSLGFRNPAYMGIERERRWLCRAVPHGLDLQTIRIADLYITGACLRLREARPLSGAPAIFRLTRKADVDSHTRLITSIYLSESEFRLLSGALPGKWIRKLRHRLPEMPDVCMAIDEFQGELAGLFLVEAEFKSSESMASFVAPDFAGPEVTDDARFTGGGLIQHGLPRELSRLIAASTGEWTALTSD